jgi:hypothetical protein
VDGVGHLERGLGKLGVEVYLEVGALLLLALQRAQGVREEVVVSLLGFTMLGLMLAVALVVAVVVAEEADVGVVVSICHGSEETYMAFSYVQFRYNRPLCGYTTSLLSMSTFLSVNSQSAVLR